MVALHVNLVGEGPLVLTAIGLHAAAFVALAVASRRGAPRGRPGGRGPSAGIVLFGAGDAAALSAWGVRWARVGHVPLQNLYEVFLSLGPLVFALSMFCRRRLRVGGQSIDALLAAAVLLPTGFVLDPSPRRLTPALQSPFFVPHVAAYVLGYLLAAKAGVQAGAQLLGRRAHDDGLLAPEPATYRMVRLALAPLTLGLALGALWAQQAWGDWWNWDPKELWSLATWLIYVLYLHFRHATGARYGRVNSALALLGLASAMITLLWANLSRLFAGLHSYA